MPFIFGAGDPHPSRPQVNELNIFGGNPLLRVGGPAAI